MIDPENVFWLTMIGLGVAVALSLFVWSWYQIRAWCWDGDDPAADAGEFLTTLRESTRQGEISSEEYRSIQSRLASRLTGTVSTSASSVPDENSPLGGNTTQDSEEQQPTESAWNADPADEA